jgi:hypothetical protein
MNKEELRKELEEAEAKVRKIREQLEKAETNELDKLLIPGSIWKNQYDGAYVFREFCKVIWENDGFDWKDTFLKKYTLVDTGTVSIAEHTPPEGVVLMASNNINCFSVAKFRNGLWYGNGSDNSFYNTSIYGCQTEYSELNNAIPEYWRLSGRLAEQAQEQLMEEKNKE